MAKNNGNGTPKTLEQAIRDALCVAPLPEVVSRTRNQVRDFLAQKFGATMLKASDNAEMEKLICELWTAITGEKCERLKK